MTKNTIHAILFWLISAFILSGCSLTRINKSKDILYNPAHQLKLDVYAPKKITKPKGVLVFIHGGNWNSGRKSPYRFLGKRMASKGVVTVIIDYRLSPQTAYQGMATDAAMALKWVKENIHSYGGDENKIFISGHSAGGHLAALISADNQYFDSLKISNPIKGTILIDAFGLDMFQYLSHPHYVKNPTYYAMFTTNPKTWQAGSPIYHLHEGMPSFLMYVGGKTYPSIIESNASFFTALKKYQPNARLITVKNKRHVPMITQFLNLGNKIYGEVIAFMEK